MTLESLKPHIKDILKQDNPSIDNRLTDICNLLQKDVKTYDWVGFYFKNGDKRELILKAYAGEPTDHIIIPFGK
jgi:GAF domain-containing protein